MSETAVQNPESATGTDGHQDYLALKDSAATSAQSQENGKSAPASEPEQQEQERSKGLTDEQKADRKRRNDERRERRWYEERGAMRAEMEQLRREVAEARESRTRDARSSDSDRPVFEEYLKSGKYETWEAAQHAWMGDTLEVMREQLRAESSSHSAASTAEEVSNQFRKNIREFSKTHPDFQDSLDAVQDAFDGPGGKGSPLTTYIVKAKDSAALIYHLGNNPDLLEELSEMDHEDAIAEIGAIRRELKAQKDAPTKETVSDGGKPPRQVAGRGSVPDLQTEMRQAADANDFTRFQKAYRASKKES